ncbi:hypothetical protein IW141_003963, partial [Coemansia sp. RSA 355]
MVSIRVIAVAALVLAIARAQDTASPGESNGTSPTVDSSLDGAVSTKDNEQVTGGLQDTSAETPKPSEQTDQPSPSQDSPTSEPKPSDITSESVQSDPTPESEQSKHTPKPEPSDVTNYLSNYLSKHQQTTHIGIIIIGIDKEQTY